MPRRAETTGTTGNKEPTGKGGTNRQRGNQQATGNQARRGLKQLEPTGTGTYMIRDWNLRDWNLKGLEPTGLEPKQLEPKGTGTSTTSYSTGAAASFLHHVILDTLKPALMLTPRVLSLISSPDDSKQVDDPGPGPSMERCQRFLDSPATCKVSVGRSKTRHQSCPHDGGLLGEMPRRMKGLCSSCHRRGSNHGPCASHLAP